MELIGKLKPSLHGNQYALTVIDMLTNYTWCISLYTKDNNKVVYTYLGNILVGHTRFCHTMDMSWRIICFAQCLHFRNETSI